MSWVTAMTGTDDHRAYYILEGDLHQMGVMEEYLRRRGFNVVKSNVYPGFAKDNLEEYKRALKEIYDNRIEGWWNQQSKLIEHGICTEADYKAALDVECAKRK